MFLGPHACAKGEFGAVRIPFVIVHQPPPLQLSLFLVLHTEVYVKALRKAVTCTGPPHQSIGC